MSNFFSDLRPSDTSSPVTLYLNEESITLQPAQYTGKTVSQLFAEYATGMGDVTRINRYVMDGRIIPETQVVRSGESVRGAVTSENKGNR
jgi:hypothetical protein